MLWTKVGWNACKWSGSPLLALWLIYYLNQLNLLRLLWACNKGGHAHAAQPSQMTSHSAMAAPHNHKDVADASGKARAAHLVVPDQYAAGEEQHGREDEHEAEHHDLAIQLHGGDRLQPVQHLLAWGTVACLYEYPAGHQGHTQGAACCVAL